MSATRTFLALIAVGLLSGCNLTDEFSAAEEEGVAADYAGAEAGTYVRDTDAGRVLTTPDGMTVYTYDKEIVGSPSCYGRCAEDWSPVIASAGAKPVDDMTLLDRIDGSKQWAYQGKALYTYDGDTKPGDVSGDNQDDGVWHVVTVHR